MSRLSADRRGFSLVELMIAAVMLAGGLIAVAHAGSRGYRYSLDSAGRADMDALAGGKLEELRLVGSTAAADSTQLTIGGSTTTSVAGHADTVPDARGESHVRRWTVAVGPGGQWTRSVTVRVRPLSASAPAAEFADRTTLIALLR